MLKEYLTTELEKIQSRKDGYLQECRKLEAALKACGAKQIGETLKINVLEHEIPEDPAEIWLGSWKNLL